MSRRFRASGFTAAEMLVAAALVGIVTGVAALGCYAVSLAVRKYSEVATVALPAGAISNFYPGQTGNNVNAMITPNYSTVARAESLREKFSFDIAQSIAVYCLARNSGTFNTIRPSSIASPAEGTVLDTPEAFRAYLGTLYTAAATTFVSYRNHPATAPCFSIYILGYSNRASTIPVIAVYDMDIVPARDPANASKILGNYVTVRRYVNGLLSAYYDAVFLSSSQATDQWSPPVVAFERAVRKAVNEGTAIDRFKVAQEQPFYLVFWPDPSRENLRLPAGNTLISLNPSFANTDARKAYNHMAGRTSFMFAVPMFPSS